MDSVQRVVVLPKEPIGEINPYIHGHFAEHLGELIYPGVFVGTDSSIPNIGGIRNDVVDVLKTLEIPVLRWPGGCFADSYHWRDGVGPAALRPKRINVHWGMAEETNQFGTHEFMALCRALGTEPYFAANLGSAAPEETRDWVEYCNFAGCSTLADQRRANGSAEPFRINFWGVGNETWGCGGHMSPQEYADEFSRYRTFVFDYPGTKIDAIACGPNEWDWEWTQSFFEAIQSRKRMKRLQGFAGHYYCGTAGTATEYTEEQWLELLSKASAIEGIITGHRAIMDEYDPQRKVKMIYDEWGAWHPVEKGKPLGGLYQQNTIRDACVAALTLDIFHNHADKIFMANIAQVINVLQSVLLVEGGKVVKTPTFHVFDLYKPHKGAKAVRLVSGAEVISDGGAAADHCRRCYRDKQTFGLRAVQGSASVKSNQLCVTLVNSHPTQPVDVDLEITDARMESAELVTLYSHDIHAHNTFDEPNVVRLSPARHISIGGARVCVPLPAASVTRLMGRLL
jgi:alpha-L-arabinofuranosidase